MGIFNRTIKARKQTKAEREERSRFLDVIDEKVVRLRLKEKLAKIQPTNEGPALYLIG